MSMWHVEVELVELVVVVWVYIVYVIKKFLLVLRKRKEKEKNLPGGLRRVSSPRMTVVWGVFRLVVTWWVVLRT